MDKPVTKRELNKALEVWGGAIEARLEARLGGRIDASHRVLLAELGRHANRILEETRQMIGVLDEKLERLTGNLTKRVEALEANAPPPKRQRRR